MTFLLTLTTSPFLVIHPTPQHNAFIDSFMTRPGGHQTHHGQGQHWTINMWSLLHAFVSCSTFQLTRGGMKSVFSHSVTLCNFPMPTAQLGVLVTIITSNWNSPCWRHTNFGMRQAEKWFRRNKSYDITPCDSLPPFWWYKNDVSLFLLRTRDHRSHCL